MDEYIPLLFVLKLKKEGEMWCELVRRSSTGAKIISEKSISSGMVPGKHRHFRPLTRGTVLDHIPAGKGKLIRSLLGELEETTVIVLAENIPSSRFRRKDVIVFDNFFPPEEFLWAISFLWPQITVNIMRDNIHSKLKYDVPTCTVEVTIFRCPHCSNVNRFSLVRDADADKRILAECRNCRRKFTREEILVFFKQLI